MNPDTHDINDIFDPSSAFFNGALSFSSPPPSAQNAFTDGISPDTLTAGQIQASLDVRPSGFIKGGQSAYNTGTGFFLGYQDAAYKFSLGDPTGNYLTWDGSALSLVGSFTVGATFTAAEAITIGDAVAGAGYQSDGGVTLDTKTGGNGTDAINHSSYTVTTAVTVAANSNRFLICCITLGNIGGNDVSSVRYNGVDFTQLFDIVGTGAQRMYVGYLKAPATGANNFTFSIDKSGSPSATSYYGFVLYSYYNVDQTSPIDTSNSTGSMSTAASSSTSTTPANDGSLVWAAFAYMSANTGDNSGETKTFPTFNTQDAVGTPAGTSRVTAGDFGKATTPTSLQTITYAATVHNINVGLAIVGIKAVTAVVYGYVQKASANPSDANTGRYKAFLGFAQKTVAAGASVAVTTAGTVSGLSGLTPFTQYYLSNTAGQLSSSAGTNTRKAGIALSSTSLTVTNIW